MAERRAAAEWWSGGWRRRAIIIIGIIIWFMLPPSIIIMSIIGIWRGSARVVGAVSVVLRVSVVLQNCGGEKWRAAHHESGVGSQRRERRERGHRGERHERHQGRRHRQRHRERGGRKRKLWGGSVVANFGLRARSSSRVSLSRDREFTRM